MADDLTIDVSLRSTLTATGDQKRAEPGQKTIASISRIWDHTVSVALSTNVVLWDASLAGGQPTTWEAAALFVLTSGASFEVLDTANSIARGHIISDKMPFFWATRDAGAALAGMTHKVVKIEGRNPSASAACLVRLLLFGPEA